MKRFQTEICCRCSIEFLGILNAEAGYSGSAFHTHPFFELFYIAEGAFQIRTQQQTYFAEQGDLFLISPEVKHACTAQADGKLVYLGVGYFSQWQQAQQSCFSCDQLRPLPAFSRICNLLEQLPPAESLRDVSAVLLGAVSELMNSLLEDCALSHNEILCEKIKSYIHTHLDQPVTVTSIAEAMYMNPRYLSKLFRSANSCSVKEYVLTCKMQNAFRMLKENQLSVSQIAEALGFETVQYFSTKFREYYGISPREYKTRLSGKETL